MYIVYIHEDVVELLGYSTLKQQHVRLLGERLLIEMSPGLRVY